MNMAPLWLQVLVAVLALAGAAIALVGSLGVLTLSNFFSRVHAPALIATLGCWCILHAACAWFWWHEGSPPLRLYLIAFFVATTVPVTSIFLMRAGLFRSRRAGLAVPASLSGGPLPTTDAPEPGAQKTARGE